VLRLSPVRLLSPRALAEAVAAKAEHGARAAYLAGGTDLVPKLKRRQQEPELLVRVDHLAELRGIRNLGDAVEIGSATTLAALAREPAIRDRWPALAHAAAQVGNPIVRNRATLGGNVCLETRCSYYDQSLEWREAIHFCLKKDGDACRVAASSERCWAIQASDTAPVLIALGARIAMCGSHGTRYVDASAFYRDDGIRFLEKQPDELVTGVRLSRVKDAEATYLKVSRRMSVDFPLLSVAAWIRREAPQAPVLEARLVLGAVGSAPVLVPEAAQALVGQPLGRDSIQRAAEAAWRRARPLDNADESALWRKKAVRPYVARALEQLASPVASA
jgi:4-hydroxybenzoyl-CoA reductase subunit beta